MGRGELALGELGTGVTDGSEGDLGRSGSRRCGRRGRCV